MLHLAKTDYEIHYPGHRGQKAKEHAPENEQAKGGGASQVSGRRVPSRNMSQSEFPRQ